MENDNINDLRIIKKKYGERMMHLCRTLFPTILETPGVLSNLILNSFEPSRYLYDDLVKNGKIDDFKNYIYCFVSGEKRERIVTCKTPEELLSDAGYILYECKTEDKIQSFKKYYAPQEELCTFLGGRLNSCDVFFAVKKDVNDIKRSDFIKPEREDKYGTSVISIQFRKGYINTLSIKNRYNHTVKNPDNTFNNDLDNIILGLTDSFARAYQYNIDYSYDIDDFELDGYVNVNGKFYKYNYEINNVYYCPNNIIIDNFKVIDKYSREPERYIVLDFFIIDLKLKTIELYKDCFFKDSFADEFKNIDNIVITKIKDSNNKRIEIMYDGGKKAVIIINEMNQIIEYHNNYLIKMDDKCLVNSTFLNVFEASSLVRMGNHCLENAKSLINFEAPNLIEMGRYCLKNANSLISFKAPNLTVIDAWSLENVGSLVIFETPNLIIMEQCVLKNASSLINFEALNLTKMGSYCLRNAYSLISFKAPKLIKIGIAILKNSSCLNSFEAPNLPLKGIERIVKLTTSPIPCLEEILKNKLYVFNEFKGNNMEVARGR